MGSTSLAARLFLAAALWSAIMLLVAGFTLSSIYRNAVESAFDQRLSVYLRTLVADLATHGDLERAEFGLGEPRFELPLSGFYWQVTRFGGSDTKASRSLFDRSLPLLIDLDPDKDTTATREAYVDGPDGAELRQVERIIDLGNDRRFVVAVAGEADEIADATREFDTALLVSFFLLGLGLMATASLQVGYGLRPLARISRRIAEIRSGAADRIDGEVPREIAPLAREINALLESNREIVERARTHVGNLAHALKTPLSVVTNEVGAGGGPLAEKVAEQVSIMRTQIDHHLERARIAAGVAIVGEVTEVAPVVQGLARTMEKVHRGKDLHIDVVSEPVRFRGERQDLEEMIGNLVDNACKWAARRVAIEVVAERRTDQADRAWLRVFIDDDGPGLSGAEREAVLKRGKRLDETKPGSGLGLAIVSELAALYGGGLWLATAPSGGLRADLKLPAV